MKKIVALLLTCLLILSVAGCSSSSSNPQETTKKSTTSTTNVKTLSKSERKEIAEREALKMLLKVLKESYPRYDIDSTRYKIGSITGDYGDYEVNGTLYLYDKYGNLEDTATFSCCVEVKDDGSYKAYRPKITIK